MDLSVRKTAGGYRVYDGDRASSILHTTLSSAERSLVRIEQGLAHFEPFKPKPHTGNSTMPYLQTASGRVRNTLSK